MSWGRSHGRGKIFLAMSIPNRKASVILWLYRYFFPFPTISPSIDFPPIFLMVDGQENLEATTMHSCRVE
jgi:hypothetical protein